MLTEVNWTPTVVHGWTRCGYNNMTNKEIPPWEHPDVKKNLVKDPSKTDVRSKNPKSAGLIIPYKSPLTRTASPHQIASAAASARRSTMSAKFKF